MNQTDKKVEGIIISLFVVIGIFMLGSLAGEAASKRKIKLDFLMCVDTIPDLEFDRDSVSECLEN